MTKFYCPICDFFVGRDLEFKVSHLPNFDGFIWLLREGCSDRGMGTTDCVVQVSFWPPRWVLHCYSFVLGFYLVIINSFWIMYIYIGKKNSFYRLVKVG